MALVLRFQTRLSLLAEHGESSEPLHSNSLFRGLKILLADADDVNRAVTRKLLEKLGCNVSAVSSGYECLTALSPTVSSYQIIVLDLHMPDLDGFEVSIRIRKFWSRNYPPIVALTASDVDNSRERCMQIGMNDVIQKPCSLQGIAREIRLILLQSNRMM